MHRSKRPVAVLIWILTVATGIAAASPALAVDGGEAQWIWSPDHPPFNAPKGECYFRKTFRSGGAEAAASRSPAITAMSCSSTAASSCAGSDWKTFDVYDIQKLLVPGNNTIAVHAFNDADARPRGSSPA